jgi:arsenate reductase
MEKKKNKWVEFAEEFSKNLPSGWGETLRESSREFREGFGENLHNRAMKNLKGITMKKQVLILCTGNSCRSIMAEALINAKLGGCVEAQSSGVAASGKVNPYAQELLANEGLWQERYHSKVIEEVMNEPFDLIITVCDHAKETCPLFPKPIKTIHVGFEDPTGKAVEEYAKTLALIEEELLPVVEKELC